MSNTDYEWKYDIDTYAEILKAKLKKRPINEQCAIFFRCKGHKISEAELEMAFYDTYLPKRSQLIPALLQLGVRNKDIAAYLKITPAAVSIYSKRKTFMRYVNSIFHEVCYGIRTPYTQEDSRTTLEKEIYIGNRYYK